jgi:hypothetical protein
MSDEKPKRIEKLNLFEQGFDILPYRDLPVAYQMAMAWYMAVTSLGRERPSFWS